MISKLLVLIVIALNWNGIYPSSNTTDSDKIAWHEDNQLSWGDYLGSPNLRGRFNAESSLLISYKLGISSNNDNVKINFTVECLFDTKSSWVNPANKTTTLLQHEQLHFDIAEVYARKLRKILSDSKFTIKNYKSKSSDIFDNNFKDYKNFQEIYDSETNHGILIDQQQTWEKKVYTLLKRLDNYKRKSN